MLKTKIIPKKSSKYICYSYTDQDSNITFICINDEYYIHEHDNVWIEDANLKKGSYSTFQILNDKIIRLAEKRELPLHLSCLTLIFEKYRGLYAKGSLC